MSHGEKKRAQIDLLQEVEFPSRGSVPFAVIYSRIQPKCLAISLHKKIFFKKNGQIYNKEKETTFNVTGHPSALLPATRQ